MGKRVVALALVALLLCVLVCPAFASSNGDTIVYRTRTGECYHTGSCSYLRSSKIEITLADAVSRGLRPCSRCNPPRYKEDDSLKTEQEPTTAPAYSSASDTSKTVSQTFPDRSLPIESFDMEEFRQKQQQAQDEHEAAQKQIKEMQNNLKTIEKNKPATTTSSGSSAGVKIIAYLIGIVAFASIGNYLYGKFRRL